MQNQIQEFNQSLLNENIEITIIDYVKAINDEYFKIDISFIDDFIDMVDKDECCISHDLLVKYGVTNISSGTNDIKKIIERNEGREDHDYKVRQLAYSLDYILHPTFFKKILIRCRNTDKYAEYYLLLEKCVKYYNEYQLLKIQDK